MSDSNLDAYQALLALMRGRRSIRRFRAEPVDAGTLDRLMEAARWAPSVSNRQPFRFVAVESPETRTRMARLVREAVADRLARMADEERAAAAAYAEDFSRFEQAPLVLAAYHRGSHVLAERVGLAHSAEVGTVSSVAAAIMQLLLAAHALGLGACWMTGPLCAAPALEALLAIPAGWQLSALIPIGVPDEAPPPPPRRTAAQLVRQPGGPP
jgi:coenzyme F420-0:L-glutamate ligase / coenzyme F420-1:gamma-L-glutamate ligase